ncbi:MAG: hypothetical protein JWP84_4628 [Tardiphaga sp.]|nr:hypothetical protein [Tardiphaga sp.]
MTASPTMKLVSPKSAMWLMISAGLLLVLLANAHLVYMAVTSQPECIDHIKRGATVAESGKFSAASSSCTPR